MGKYLDIADEAIRRLDMHGQPATRETSEESEVTPCLVPEAQAEPAAGQYVHDERRCDDCARGPFTLLLVTVTGMRICRTCSAETTRIPTYHQPATPALDRWIAQQDADAEKERA